MADFGFWELALIMLVALVVVGPERLPKLALQVGEIFGKFKRLAHNFKDDLADAADDEFRNTIEQQRDALRQTGEDINSRLRKLDPLASSMEKQIMNGRFSDAGEPDETMDEAAFRQDESQAEADAGSRAERKREMPAAGDKPDQS